MKTGFFFLIILTILLVLVNIDREPDWSIKSPNGHLNLDLYLHQSKLYYKVLNRGNEVIGESQLGVIRSDADLFNELHFSRELPSQLLNDSIQLLSGKQLAIKEEGISKSWEFKNPAGDILRFECKMFNDGIALRYVFPGTTKDTVKLTHDKTEFKLWEGGKAWMQAYDRITDWSPAYERYYQNGSEVGAVAEYLNGWCFPALFQQDGHWLLLSEAGIGGDYVGSHLDNKPNSSTYSLRWAEDAEAYGYEDNYPASTLPWKTSWKTLAFGELNDIIKSDLVKIVSEPTEFSSIDWIKPGRSSWSWLSDHDSPQDVDKLISFVDLAADMKWEYSLVDANWNKMPEDDLLAFIDYANKKSVGLIFWYNSGGSHNNVTEEPRDIISNKVKRRLEFSRLQEWGVKGLKIDFFQTDKQFAMELYKEILEDAAEYELMINFHGCTIPRGWSRTYPNLMTMESVRGAESYTFADEYSSRAPELNTIIPFTRNVIGSMDYTPVVFTDFKRPHVTTNAHELALATIFESGWQHFGDSKESYDRQPEQVKELLRNIPTTWDEVNLLSGFPGKEVILARRKGSQWYVAGINGENIKKEMSIDLSFTEDGTDMLFIGDGLDGDTFEIARRECPRIFTLTMLPYGGFSARLTPSE